MELNGDAQRPERECLRRREYDGKLDRLLEGAAGRNQIVVFRIADSKKAIGDSRWKLCRQRDRTGFAKRKGCGLESSGTSIPAGTTQGAMDVSRG